MQLVVAPAVGVERGDKNKPWKVSTGIGSRTGQSNNRGLVIPSRTWRRSSIILVLWCFLPSSFCRRGGGFAIVNTSWVRHSHSYRPRHRNFQPFSKSLTLLEINQPPPASPRLLPKKMSSTSATTLQTYAAASTNANEYSSNDKEDTTCTMDALFTKLDYNGDLPTEIAYPHQYEPHPVAKLAAKQLQAQLPSTLDVGKMFGVLVVETPKGDLGYLQAYSGTLPKTNSTKTTSTSITTLSTTRHVWIQENEKFCPLVYNREAATSFYPANEAKLNQLTADMEALEQDPQRQTQLAALESKVELAEQALAQSKQDQKTRKEARKRKRSEEGADSTSLSAEDLKAFEKDLRQQSAFDQRQIKAYKRQLIQAQEEYEAVQNQVQDLKTRRAQASTELTRRLFEHYQFLNIKGEVASLLDIFETYHSNSTSRASKHQQQTPPAGAGDCAAPKLFQAAFARGDRPIALAEFWWGPPPVSEVRKSGLYYPACRGKCEPILQGHMLKGLPVGASPVEALGNNNSNNNESGLAESLEILYEDDFLVIVNKPAELLSVPGRTVDYSVYSEMRKRHPSATGPLLVHRLDLSTSGILVVAKNKSIHKALSHQFIERSIKKRYECLLEGDYREESKNNASTKGTIELPLMSDYLNRPMQKVDNKGKPATTHYEILGVEDCTETQGTRTRAYLYPVTGRTHQLRVHAAYSMGLNLPMVGDDIYGQRDKRLCLHAGYLELTHPVTKKRMTFTCEAPF